MEQQPYAPPSYTLPGPRRETYNPCYPHLGKRPDYLPPPYPEMIITAIAALKDKDGSSLEAIAEYTENHFPNLPPSHLACLNHFINQLKDEGVLLTAGNNYMISPDSSHLIPTSFPKRNPPPKPRPNPVHRPPRPSRRPFLECYKVTPVHKGPGPAPKHQIFYREWSDKPGLLEDGPWRYCDGPSITFFLPVSSETIERVLKETESIERVPKETEPVLGRRQRSSDSSPERRNTRPRSSQSRIMFVFNNSAEGRLQNQLMHARLWKRRGGVWLVSFEPFVSLVSVLFFSSVFCGFSLAAGLGGGGVKGARALGGAAD
ncbi:hypothetical protein RJ639_034795 [Escallonia herrerae]|uniref:H15 domain-containing protein n=1 Tax=Escallonia herrerae TaxID=1293975 RepID=A0AA88X4M4_9ASTE|nr:hypothetical protein RJ639_034795 [Escallonia herrerae]